MPKLLRAISAKKNRWVWDNLPLTWLDEGDIPASPLGNLMPKTDKLSVYEITDDRSSINRIATALAVSKQKLDVIEYIVFEESVLTEIGIEMDKQAPGETYDPDVNLWHRDLVNISANKLVALVKRILPITIPDFVLPKKLSEVFEEVARSKNVDWGYVQLSNKKELMQQFRV